MSTLVRNDGSFTCPRDDGSSTSTSPPSLRGGHRRGPDEAVLDRATRTVPSVNAPLDAVVTPHAAWPEARRRPALRAALALRSGGAKEASRRREQRLVRSPASVVEHAALAWFGELGYSVLSGADLQPDSPLPLRTSYHDTNISILSDEFLMEVRDMPLKNVAVELLRKLLSGEIRARAKQNIVQSRSFAEMLEEAVRKYQNRAIEEMRVRVKRILRKYGYPPDKQEKATQTVLQQAELLLSAEVR